MIIYVIVSMLIAYLLLDINYKREIKDMEDKMEFLSKTRGKELSEVEREILIKISKGERFLGS